ncbi:MAG: DNA ligase D [Vicinamibacterales bacterium]|nr:DNA ligase D [Vicinamibacterales bacterium]
MAFIAPMLATLEDAPLEDASLVYEPKYDGIRAIIELDPAGRVPVRIWSRLGNDKTAQFPDLVAELKRFNRKLKGPVVLDGEIVALDADGEPAGFQRLQNRIHLTESNSRSAAGRVAFIAFDALRDRNEDLRSLALTARRARLERIFRNSGSQILRLSEVVPGDGRALYTRALEQGWEGVIAKGVESIYHTGRRTRDWRKLKILHEQEFVVGGWTEARTMGRPFGALLLGYYDKDGDLIYAGHTGTGFNERELDRVMKLLKPLESPASAFKGRIRTNERPHWVKPNLVAQVKFGEWTDDGALRQPVYLGMRDDVIVTSVKKEPELTLHDKRKGQGAKGKRQAPLAPPAPSAPPAHDLVAQLTAIEKGPGSGVLHLPDGVRLDVSNLRKVFWPKLKITKGDLMRYYVRVAPFILPVVAERPLIMKRFPNGVGGPSFYQQRAPEKVPAGVRVATLADDHDVPSRIIGGDLTTLIYMAQLAVISQDPWFSRVQSPEVADHCAIDLDPMPGVAFDRVLDVARWVRDELEKLKVMGYPKTSGASGIHIFIPLLPGTPYDAGQIFCQIVATVVAEKHPKAATVTRAVRARGPKVYVDYLQNIQGKSLACAYSARASEFAGASTPLTWKEIDDGVSPRDFTIRNLPDRLAEVGDLWKAFRTSKGVDLRKVLGP